MKKCASVAEPLPQNREAQSAFECGQPFDFEPRNMAALRPFLTLFQEASPTGLPTARIRSADDIAAPDTRQQVLHRSACPLLARPLALSRTLCGCPS